MLVVEVIWAAAGTCQQTPAPEQRVWSVADVLAEASPEPPELPIDYCRGGRFKPCVCPDDVSRDMRYRPAVKECGGRAAIILSGKYLNVFSAVVRDSENRDRWPLTGINGCSSYERDTLGLSRCSAFKVQRKFVIGHDRSLARVHCLGASGYSRLFRRVTRVTAKLSDLPNSTNDPLVRWCLNGPDEPLN